MREAGHGELVGVQSVGGVFFIEGEGAGTVFGAGVGLVVEFVIEVGARDSLEDLEGDVRLVVCRQGWGGDFLSCFHEGIGDEFLGTSRILGRGMMGMVSAA